MNVEPSASCQSRLRISPMIDGFRCELEAPHTGKPHEARCLGHDSDKVRNYEGDYRDLAPGVVVYVRWEEFNADRDKSVGWQPD